MRTSAIEELAQSYITVGDKEAARNLIASYAWAVPVEDWSKELNNIAGKLSLGDLALPAEDLRIVRWDDGRVVPFEIDGSNCYKTEKGSHSAYLYFRVAREELRQAEKDLVLEAEIHGSGGLAVDYGSVTSKGEPRTEQVVVSSSETGWHTVQVPLKRAKLNAALTNGTDFRISNPEGDLYIRKIEIHETGK